MNPYEATYPAPPETPTKPSADWGPWEIRYLESVAFIFRNPNWLANVLWGALCLLVGQFIPLLPNLVLVGYCYEVIEGLHKTNGQYYPDFNTNRLTDYLLRSLPPFLVMFASLAVVVPLVAVLVGVSFAVFAASAQGDETARVAGVIVATLLGPGGLVLTFLIWNFLVGALSLRGGLSGEITDAFHLSWAWDFIKKTWLETLVILAFVLLASFVLFLLGAALFCVGLFATQPILLLISAHLSFQLYRVFLSRGGDPIPLKGSPVAI